MHFTAVQNYPLIDIVIAVLTVSGREMNSTNKRVNNINPEAKTLAERSKALDRSNNSVTRRGFESPADRKDFSRMLISFCSLRFAPAPTQLNSKFNPKVNLECIFKKNFCWKL